MKIVYVDLNAVKAVRELTSGEVKRRQRAAQAYVESDGTTPDYWLLEPSSEFKPSEPDVVLVVKLREKDLKKRAAAKAEKQKKQRRRQQQAKSDQERRPERTARERDKGAGLTVLVKEKEKTSTGESVEMKSNPEGTLFRLNVFGVDGVFQSHTNYSDEAAALSAFEDAKEGSNASWRKPEDYRELAEEIIATKAKMRHWTAEQINAHRWPDIPQRLALLVEMVNRQELRDLAFSTDAIGATATPSVAPAADDVVTSGAALRGTIVEILGDLHLPPNHLFYEEYCKEDLIPKLMTTGSLRTEDKLVRKNRVENRIQALREIFAIGAKHPTLFPYCGGVLACLTDKTLLYKQKEKYKNFFLPDRSWKCLSETEFASLLLTVLEKFGLDKFNFLVHMIASPWRPEEGVKYIDCSGVSPGNDGKVYPMLMRDEIRFDFLMPNVKKADRLIYKDTANPVMNPRAAFVSYFILIEKVPFRYWSRRDFATNYKVSLRKTASLADIVARRLRTTGLTYVYYSQTTKDPRFFAPGNQNRHEAKTDIVMQRGGHKSRRMGDDRYAYMVPDIPVDDFFKYNGAPLNETKLLVQDSESGKFYDLMWGHYLSDAVLLKYFYEANTADMMSQKEKDDFDARLIKAYFYYMKVVHSRVPEPVPVEEVKKELRVVTSAG